MSMFAHKNKYLSTKSLNFKGYRSFFANVAVVIDTDGSAFITKAEFDSLKNNFQAQIDNYNTSLDSKIDGAIAAYLAGIQIQSSIDQQLIWGPQGVNFTAVPDCIRLGVAKPAIFVRPLTSKPKEVIPWHYDFFNTYSVDSSQPENVKAGLGKDRKITLNALQCPSKCNPYFLPDLDDRLDDAIGTIWGDWYKQQTDDQVRKNMWYDAVSASALYTVMSNDYITLRGVGRMSSLPHLTSLMYTFSSRTYGTFTCDMDANWDKKYFKFGDDKEECFPSLSNLLLYEQSPKTEKNVTYSYCTTDSKLNLQSMINTEDNSCTLKVNIAPVKYTVDYSPKDGATWSISDRGYECYLQFTIGDSSAFRTEPVIGFDEMTAGSATATTTRIQVKNIPYVNTGELLINEDYGGALFAENSLWIKSDPAWIEQSLAEWRLNRGTIASNIEDINNETISYKFGGLVAYKGGTFSRITFEEEDSIYHKEDCTNHNLGYLPVLKITPLDSEMKKITDFYAPLYGNDTMSPYGKSYVDGACICKTTTEGNTLRIKLKSTEETTLYFNKNPFTSCNAVGNIGYIANGNAYSAGSGVHVNADETITIDIKDVLAEDMYYVKPDTATTIQFESAVITQDS